MLDRILSLAWGTIGLLDSSHLRILGNGCNTAVVKGLEPRLSQPYMCTYILDEASHHLKKLRLLGV